LWSQVAVVLVGALRFGVVLVGELWVVAMRFGVVKGARVRRRQ